MRIKIEVTKKHLTKAIKDAEANDKSTSNQYGCVCLVGQALASKGIADAWVFMSQFQPHHKADGAKKYPLPVKVQKLVSLFDARSDPTKLAKLKSLLPCTFTVNVPKSAVRP